MNKLTVSVVIPVKNGAKFLSSAIESVLASDMLPLEIIVVDGNSVDDTEKISKSFSLVRYIKQINQGIPDAFNLGIDVAKGELIAFLSYDDLWAPNKLSTQVRYLSSHPSIQYTVTKFRYFLDDPSHIPPGFKKELLGKDLVGLILEALVARKSLFDSVGKFDTRYSTGLDVEWFARVKDRKVPMAIIPEVLVYKRVHAYNSSLNAQDNNQQLLRAMRESIERQRKSQRNI